MKEIRSRPDDILGGKERRTHKTFEILITLFDGDITILNVEEGRLVGQRSRWANNWREDCAEYVSYVRKVRVWGTFMLNNFRLTRRLTLRVYEGPKRFRIWTRWLLDPLNIRFVMRRDESVSSLSKISVKRFIIGIICWHVRWTKLVFEPQWINNTFIIPRKVFWLLTYYSRNA